MHHLFPLTLHTHKICETKDIIKCQGVEWKGHLGLFPCIIYIDGDTQEIIFNQEQYMPQIQWNHNGTIHNIHQKPIHTTSLELFSINPDDIVKLPEHIVETCCIKHPNDYDRVAHILSDTLGYLANPIHETKRDIIQRLTNASYHYLDTNDDITWCNIQQIDQAYPIYDLIQWAEPHAIMYENMENYSGRSQWTCRPSVSHILIHPQPYIRQDRDENTLPHDESSIINILYEAISMGIPAYPHGLPMPFGPYLPFMPPPTPSTTMPRLTALPTIASSPITNETFPIVLNHEQPEKLNIKNLNHPGHINNIPISTTISAIQYKTYTQETINIDYHVTYYIPDWGNTHNPVLTYQPHFYRKNIIRIKLDTTDDHWRNIYTKSHHTEKQTMIHDLLVFNLDPRVKEKQHIVKMLIEYEYTHHPNAFHYTSTNTKQLTNLGYIQKDNTIYPLWENINSIIQWIYNTPHHAFTPKTNLTYNHSEHQWNGAYPETIFEKPTNPLPPIPSHHAMLQIIRRAIALKIPHLPKRFTHPD